MPVQPGTSDELVPAEDFSYLAGLPPHVIEELRQESNSTASPELSVYDDPRGPNRTSGQMADAGGADDVDSLPKKFDSKHRVAFEGLLYLGALTSEETIAGHKFRIRTLNVGEMLEVAAIEEKYLTNRGSGRAYVTAMVAGCVVLVDGKPLPQPLSSDLGDTPLSNAYKYIIDSWYPWIVDQVYERYMVLEGRVNEILAAMGEALPPEL